MSNLPTTSYSKTSEKDVRLFFDRYYTKPISFSSNELDSVVGYFESNGFDTSAAKSVASVLLQQAKLDGIKVYKLIDTLRGYDKTQLSVIVAEVLNYNRKRTSVVGFKRGEKTDAIERRNIII